MNSLPSAALDRYDQELSIRDKRFADLDRQDKRLGSIRVALFLALLLFGFIALFSESQWLFGLLTAATFIIFLGVAVYNETIRDAIDQIKSERRVLKRLVARLNRNWEALRHTDPAKLLDGLELPKHQREVADDLDLFGSASLFQLVAIVGTTPGAQTLARWLAGPADAVAAQSRFQAVDRLAPKHEERLQFYVTADRIGHSTSSPDRFVQWASGEPWLDQRRWLTLWSNVSAVIALLLVVALIGSVVTTGLGGPVKVTLAAMLGLTLVNFAITGIFLGPANQIFSVAMTTRHSVADFRSLVSAARWTEPDSSDADADARLHSIHERLISDELSADRALEALERVAAMGGLRQSAATFLLYLPLQAFALWDVRVLKRLEAWQARYGHQAPKWFEALGELEALMSLAALRHEYPEWAVPQWQTNASGSKLVAQRIGHPLLKDNVRVANDVGVGPSGTFLLITGSNMSGKSTMLRSLGLNVALAGAGAPVCASSLTLPSIQLATSIRVRDNLAEGVSFYMAELHRLRGVVDEAKSLATTPNRTLMFLLDEILQGTNSRERLIAVGKVVESLVDYEAIGAISTHDLELADDASLTNRATVVHFRETIEISADGTEQMLFDYQMREGVSPTTNALRLLEMVGLGSRKP